MSRNAVLVGVYSTAADSYNPAAVTCDVTTDLQTTDTHQHRPQTADRRPCRIYRIQGYRIQEAGDDEMIARTPSLGVLEPQSQTVEQVSSIKS